MTSPLPGLLRLLGKSTFRNMSHFINLRHQQNTFTIYHESTLHKERNQSIDTVDGNTKIIKLRRVVEKTFR